MESAHLQARHLRPTGPRDCGTDEDVLVQCCICLGAVKVALSGGASYERLAQCASCKNVLHRQCVRRMQRIGGSLACPLCRVACDVGGGQWDLAPEVVTGILDERDADYAPRTREHRRHSTRLIEQRARSRRMSTRSTGRKSPDPPLRPARSVALRRVVYGAV